MRACGICGSDVEKVFGKYGQPSMRLGHEPAGIITQVGDAYLKEAVFYKCKDCEFPGYSPEPECRNCGKEDADKVVLKVGDRVFTHHHVACYDCHECSHGNETMCEKYYKSNLEPCGLADEYIVPEWNVKNGGVLKIPDSMTFEEAAMIEPLACCIRAWKKVAQKTVSETLSTIDKRDFESTADLDTVAILGVGPTGIMHALLAKMYGFGRIFCVDFNKFRLNFVDSIFGTGIQGAVTINCLRPGHLGILKDETANQGVDVVIVATSSLSALKDAVNFVRKGGTIVMFGVPNKGETVELDMSEVYSKGITIVNSYAASDFDTKEALEKISNKQINVSQLITHKYNLQECQEAFVHAKSGDNAMKIIISN
jgi:L-iditol 2-dehydrogenase